MSRCFPGLLILTVAATAAAWTNSAQAQGFGGYGGYSAFYGFNGGAGPYNLYDNERVVPHFALYPPVYYSAPVPRSYGWSPFAYPPGMMTPEAPLRSRYGSRIRKCRKKRRRRRTTA